MSTIIRCSFLILLLGTAAPAGAQAVPEDRAFVRTGAGVGWGQATVAGEAGNGVGPMLTVQLGLPGPVVLDASLQPFRVANPARAEAYRALTVLPSLEWRTSALYLRGGVGAGVASWTGDDVWVEWEVLPAAGLALGTDATRLLGEGWSLEVASRGAFAPELVTSTVVVQLMRVWPGASF